MSACTTGGGHPAQWSCAGATEPPLGQALAHAMLQAEGTERTGPVQGRLYRSLKLWTFYCDLEESLGTLESTKAVYDSIMDLKLATPQIVLNYAAFLQVGGGLVTCEADSSIACGWACGALHPGKLLLSSRLQRRGCCCPKTASSFHLLAQAGCTSFTTNACCSLQEPKGCGSPRVEGALFTHILDRPAVALLPCGTSALYSAAGAQAVGGVLPGVRACCQPHHVPLAPRGLHLAGLPIPVRGAVQGNQAGAGARPLQAGLGGGVFWDSWLTVLLCAGALPAVQLGRPLHQ